MSGQDGSTKPTVSSGSRTVLELISDNYVRNKQDEAGGTEITHHVPCVTGNQQISHVASRLKTTYLKVDDDLLMLMGEKPRPGVETFISSVTAISILYCYTQAEAHKAEFCHKLQRYQSLLKGLFITNIPRLKLLMDSLRYFWRKTALLKRNMISGNRSKVSPSIWGRSWTPMMLPVSKFCSL